MAAFHVTVTTGAGTPIYRQIVDQVRLAVATGTLPLGHAMPSVRGLAEELLINFFAHLVPPIARARARAAPG